MKKRSFLAAIAAVGVGGAATWGLGSFVYQKIFSGEELTLSQGTALMPDNALMAGLIDLESGDLEANIESLNKLTNNEFGQGWEAFNQELFNRPDITYEKDIAPWLGNVFFALLPEPEGPKPVIIAGIKDKLQALSFANKMDGKEEPTTYDYKGVEVSKTSNNAFAVLDDFIVVAPASALVEKVIDTEQGGPSLQDQGIEPQFSMEQPFIQAFIPNYANFMELVTAEEGSQGLSPQLQASLKMISNMGYAVDFEDNQIQIQGTVDIDPAAIAKQKPTMFTSTAIKKLPADTLMMVNVDLSSFNQGWSAMLEASQEIPESKRVFDGMRNLVKRFTGLNVEEDLVNWMDEEFALAITPSSKPIAPQFPISGNFLVGTSKPAEAAKSLTKLDSFIQKSVPPNIVNKSQTKVDGKEITQWDTFQKQTLFSYGWLDKNTLLTSIGDNIGNSSIGKGESLDQNPKFKDLASQFPQKNFGYFYWNLADSVKLIPPAQLQLSTPGQQSFIQSLDAALTTSFLVDDDTIEYNSIITLSPPEPKN